MTEDRMTFDEAVKLFETYYIRTVCDDTYLDRTVEEALVYLENQNPSKASLSDILGWEVGVEYEDKHGYTYRLRQPNDLQRFDEEIGFWVYADLMVSDLEHVNFHKLTLDELVCLDQALIQAKQKSKDEFTKRGESKHKASYHHHRKDTIVSSEILNNDTTSTEQEHLFNERYEKLQQYEKNVQDSLDMLSIKYGDIERIDDVINANLERTILWLDNDAKNIFKDYAEEVERVTNLYNWEYATSTKEVNKNILEARLKLYDFIGKLLVFENYVQQQKVLSSQSDY